MRAALELRRHALAMSPAPPLVLVALLAFGVGFATQRGSVCGILAARQIVETKKATRFIAFVMASLWALVVVVPLAWLTRAQPILSPSYEGALIAILGGALYGLGTVINGACVFGTVARTFSGSLAFLAALPGIAFGAGLGTTLGLPLLRSARVASPLSEPSLGGLALLIVAAALVLTGLLGMVRGHRRAGLGLGPVLRASRWRTSFAMMIIGVLGGLLFATSGPWSYPSLMRQLGHLALGHDARFAATTIVGPLALMAGAAVAAAAGGRFALRPIAARQIARSLFGGTAMGLAATLVPGGNDVLLLSALPSLALHGALAYSGMLAVQIVSLGAARRWKIREARRWAARQRCSGSSW
jgi:uncharacterized protein